MHEAKERRRLHLLAHGWFQAWSKIKSSGKRDNRPTNQIFSALILACIKDKVLREARFHWGWSWKNSQSDRSISVYNNFRGGALVPWCPALQKNSWEGTSSKIIINWMLQSDWLLWSKHPGLKFPSNLPGFVGRLSRFPEDLIFDQAWKRPCASKCKRRRSFDWCDQMECAVSESDSTWGSWNGWRLSLLTPDRIALIKFLLPLKLNY